MNDPSQPPPPPALYPAYPASPVHHAYVVEGTAGHWLALCTHCGLLSVSGPKNSALYNAVGHERAHETQA